jgi:putative ABC transport system permease protein
MFRWLFRRLPRVLIARRNLSRARTRTILAVVAIVIGVVAISSMGMFGSAFRRQQWDLIGDVGNSVVVTPDEQASFEELSREHVAEIRRTVPEADVVPLQQAEATVRTMRDSREATVWGVREPRRLYDARSGTIPDPWRDGALVGSDLADRLDVEPGDAVTVDGETYRVRAVLAEAGFSSIASPDRAVVLPQESFDDEGYDRVALRTESAVAANDTATAVDRRLNDRTERVQVTDRAMLADRVDRQLATINTFLLGVGGISLLVAGVSILNVMLMSAMERREEVGVLRAVGYQRSDVVRIMLSEAAILGVVGSLVGLGLSLGVGLVVNDAMLNDPWAFDAAGLRYATVGFALGVGASVVGGLYPAWKAANAEPVEALRG